ncbi:MAG TPA: hypothetical protein VFR06_06795 [Gallionellaceae bacterium]|nr:hypothetical protein [Gallionellaceae bacterium]
MQFIPIIPRAGKLLEDWLEVRRLSAVRGARPVEPRTLPPLVTPARAAERGKREPEEERRAAQQGERRRYCRRVLNRPILEELRSALDRRKHSQRKSDQAGHIDEEA